MYTYHIPDNKANSHLAIDDGKPVVKLFDLTKMSAEDVLDATGYSLQAWANKACTIKFYLANLQTLPLAVDMAQPCASISEVSLEPNKTYWSQGKWTDTAAYLLVEITPTDKEGRLIVNMGLTFTNATVEEVTSSTENSSSTNNTENSSSTNP